MDLYREATLRLVGTTPTNRETRLKQRDTRSTGDNFPMTGGMILCSSGVFFVRGLDGHWVVPDGPDVGAILELGPQLGVDGIEVLVTRGMLGHLDAVTGLLNEMTLPVPAVHAPKRVGAALPEPAAVDMLEETARFAARIGAEVAVLHLWDLPDGDRDFDGRLDAVTVAAGVFEPHGVTLAIETIPCLVSTPLRNIERVLQREPRVGVALDTEFLAMHDEIDDALAAAGSGQGFVTCT